MGSRQTVSVPSARWSCCEEGASCAEVPVRPCAARACAVRRRRRRPGCATSATSTRSSRTSATAPASSRPSSTGTVAGSSHPWPTGWPAAGPRSPRRRRGWSSPGPRRRVAAIVRVASTSPSSSLVRSPGGSEPRRAPCSAADRAPPRRASTARHGRRPRAITPPSGRAPRCCSWTTSAPPVPRSVPPPRPSPVWAPRSSAISSWPGRPDLFGRHLPARTGGVGTMRHLARSEDQP